MPHEILYAVVLFACHPERFFCARDLPGYRRFECRVRAPARALRKGFPTDIYFYAFLEILRPKEGLQNDNLKGRAVLLTMSTYNLS